MRLINPCFHFHIFILWFAIQSDNVDNKNVNDKIAFEECFRVHRVRRERPCRKNFFNYRRSSHKRSSDLENDLFPLDGGDAQRYDDKRTLGLFEKEGLLRLGTISRFNFTIIINIVCFSLDWRTGWKMNRFEVKDIDYLIETHSWDDIRKRESLFDRQGMIFTMQIIDDWIDR